MLQTSRMNTSSRLEYAVCVSTLFSPCPWSQMLSLVNHSAWRVWSLSPLLRQHLQHVDPARLLCSKIYTCRHDAWDWMLSFYQFCQGSGGSYEHILFWSIWRHGNVCHRHVGFPALGNRTHRWVCSNSSLNALTAVRSQLQCQVHVLNSASASSSGILGLLFVFSSSDSSMTSWSDKRALSSSSVQMVVRQEGLGATGAGGAVFLPLEQVYHFLLGELMWT